MGVFRKPPIEPIIVANKIISFIRKLSDDGRVIRTAEVKAILGKLANTKDYLVYPSKESAWLLDVVWLHRETGEIHLAVESEWGNQKQVLYDFQKLLCVKSPLKIMVYFDKRGSLVGQFEEYMQSFSQHLEGENYLLVEFAPEPPDRAYLYCVKNVKNGRLRAVKFSTLRLP